MSAAKFTLTVPDLGLEQAWHISEAFDNDLRIDALAVTINETDEQASRWEIVAYFAEMPDAEVAQRIFGGHTGAVPDVDWVRKSLQGLAPVAAGRFHLHGSHDWPRAGGVSLLIDAGTAFGTGHHGTTEGCLLALEQILKRRKPARILDVGCGTGVLAIAAARATGNKALASDIDPEAVRVTRLNAGANRAGPQVRAITAAGLKDPRLLAAAPYDLIFANILARPLVALAQGLAQILAPGGDLVLSGLTRDQCRWIRATYRNHGLVPRARILRGNWAALILTKSFRAAPRRA